MSNATRLNESSDDDDDSHNIIPTPDSNNWNALLQGSSSDSEDLEVVEDGGTPQSATYERTNSQGDESPYHISNFYQSYDTYKSEQEEPSYSLDDPANGDDFNHDYEPKFESSISKKSSKKKKDKSSKNNESSSSVPSNKKSSKRKHNSEESHSKHSKRFHSESSDTRESKHKGFSSSKQSYSDDSEINPVSYYESGQSNNGYLPEFTSPIKSPAPLPDLSADEDETPSFKHYGKEEKRKSQKKMKIDRHHKGERIDIDTRLDSTNIGNKLMQKMGYRDGEGLGKNAQGRVDPVELSKQKGRRGLGLSLPGIDDKQSVEWDASLEEISIHEPIEWLKNHDYDILDCEMMMDSWLTEGPKNIDIGTMTDFIDEELLSSVLQKKTVFDNLSDDELQRTIIRSNPFETIRKGIFMNRAAVKMANIDSAFDFMFTEPKDRKDRPLVQESELLYFADVCAGPGGFSEYILWRKKWRAKGIGFTLKGDCDFKIQDFNAGPSETFEPYYGVHDDGNIFDPENISSLTDFVMKVTDDKGVHFMMADGENWANAAANRYMVRDPEDVICDLSPGFSQLFIDNFKGTPPILSIKGLLRKPGFSVKGQENIQEILSKQLYLCQFLVALCIVREEGHFVCKLFDLFSPFSAGLIYLIYRAFDKICIFKPNTSRPANSERYIICKNRKKNIDEIRQYLFKINERLWKMGSATDRDIVECVPVSIIKDNSEFFTYLRDSNNRLGNKQVISLDKVIAYFKDPNLHEPQQSALRKQCMEVWNIPHGPRRIDQSSDLETTKTIIKNVYSEKYKPECVSDTLNLRGKKLNPKNLKEIFDFSILDWECVPLGSDKLVFLLGLGKNRVYQWCGSRWDHEDKVNIELPPGTLLYGEFVPEYRGHGMSQKKIIAFHIIDGLSVGYEIISNYDYSKRISILNLFALALKKYNNNSMCPIRVKSPREMKDINQIFSSVVEVFMKSGNYEMCLQSNEGKQGLSIQMKGICFIRTTKEPWRKHLSKSTNYFYYYNSATRASVYERDRDQESVATTIDSLKNQVLWMWEAGVGFKREEKVSNVLHKDDLLKFIRHKCQ